MTKIKAITNRKIANPSLDVCITKITKLPLYKTFAEETELDSIVLREKDLSLDEYTKLLEEISSICEQHSVDLFIHNFYELLDGKKHKKIHLPYHRFFDFMEKDLYDENRLLFDEIGISVHSLEEAKHIEKILESKKIMQTSSFKGAYITIGNIFETTCKPGKEGVGLELLQEIINNVSFLKVYAIGGINRNNISQFKGINDLQGLCVMSDWQK